MNRREEIETRLSQILQEMDQDNADLDALEAEVRSLREELQGINSAAERRNRLRSEVAAGQGIVQRSFPTPAQQQPQTYNAASPEYRSAFLKDLLSLDMTREERAAFVHTTANTAAPLPTTMLNQIWDLVSENHSIMADITIYRTGTILEVLKHTAIAAGDAKIVAENEANDDEENTFVKVTLSGKDFSKHVDISYAMQRMSIDALESYLVNEISTRLGDAMAKDVLAQIDTDMTSGNKLTTATAGTVTYKELAGTFAKLKRAKNVRVYANYSTIYTHLVGMTDTTNRPIFQPSVQAGAQGMLLGAQIREESGIADGVILIGDPKKLIYNMVQDIMLESDKDIKKHVVTHSGYARGSGALVAPDAFAQLTVKSA